VKILTCRRKIIYEWNTKIDKKCSKSSDWLKEFLLLRNSKKTMKKFRIVY
jgi:hypothetical protein